MTCVLARRPAVFAIFFQVFLFAQGILFAQPAHSELRKGDRLYDKQQYQNAESAYRRADSDPTAAYNAGNAAFQQGKYEAAAEQYKKSAALAALPDAKSDALYNLGNAYLQQEKYKEAIDAYQRSLRLRPNRPDCKKNLQIAKNLLRQQQEPPPPPPPKPPPPPPPPPRNNYVDRAEQPLQAEQTIDPMSAEAARQMLNGIDREEQKNARRYRALPPEANPARTKKDW